MGFFNEINTMRVKPYYEANDTICQSKAGEEARIMSILANSQIDSNNRWEDLITIQTNLTRSRRWFYENGWEIKDAKN